MWVSPAASAACRQDLCCSLPPNPLCHSGFARFPWAAKLSCWLQGGCGHSRDWGTGLISWCRIYAAALKGSGVWSTALCGQKMSWPKPACRNGSASVVAGEGESRGDPWALDPLYVQKFTLIAKLVPGLTEFSCSCCPLLHCCAGQPCAPPAFLKSRHPHSCSQDCAPLLRAHILIAPHSKQHLEPLWSPSSFPSCADSWSVLVLLMGHSSPWPSSP